MTATATPLPRGTKAKATGALPPVAEVDPIELGTLLELPLEDIDVGPNVRANVDGIEELTASVAEHGVLQPIKVRPAGGRWLVTWGQRRLLAARAAGLARIPAIVEPLGPGRPANELAVEQLVENLHRADLNPIDRAQAMKAVVASGVSQADLARSLGLAPSTVANDLGILDAPAKVRMLIEQGAITPSHAKAMKGLAPKAQIEVAERAAREGWSAHRTEQEVQEAKRRADAEQKRVEATTKQRTAHAEQLTASIAGWTAKKVPLDAPIIVESHYGYGSSSGDPELVALIQAAGYPNVRAAKSWNETNGRSKGCDCTAWKAATHSTYQGYQDGIQINSYRASISRCCVDPKHQKAKEADAEKARRAKAATQDAVEQAVRKAARGWALEPDLVGEPAVAIQRILAEAALFSLLSYRLPEWSIGHGGTRTNPWAAIHGLSDEKLAMELAMAIASDFRDHAGYHVDWATLAIELGVEA